MTGAVLDIRRWPGFIRGILPENRFDLAVFGTLLLLLLYSSDYWYATPPVSVLVVIALVFPALRLDPRLWFAITFITVFGNVYNWHEVDNHKHLLGYWCFAVFLCCFADDPKRVLADCARWFLAAVFLIAVLWKAINLDYVTSDFFHYELLFDSRFFGLTQHIGGLSQDLIAFNDLARDALRAHDSTLAEVAVASTPGVRGLAVFITWWTILIELLCGALFVLPRSWRLYAWRNHVLLIFIFTTYGFAPVVGFGWTLAVMGIAQLRDGEKSMLAVYIAALLFLELCGPFFNRLGSLLIG